MQKKAQLPFPFQSTFDVLVFPLNLVALFASLLWPYMFCNFANSVTERMLLLGDVAFGSDWYTYPPKLQKYIVLIIARSNKPVFFSGLGLIRATLETFGKVRCLKCAMPLIYSKQCFKFGNIYLQLLKSSTSYYVLFRSFSQR